MLHPLVSLCVRSATLAATLVAITILPVSAAAANEIVVHNFVHGQDGVTPRSGLARDAAGNLYGTAEFGGGRCGCGVVYMLTPASGGWTERILHAFTGHQGDGAQPYAGVILDANGNLYGTTTAGGVYGSGIVYELVLASDTWTEKVLYSFTGGNDGGSPFGSLLLDHSGNLFGTTSGGGAPPSHGVVFELSLGVNGWSESVLYSFTGGSDGSQPVSNLISDAAGNLYGTTAQGGSSDAGTVFEVSPASGGGWTESLVYSFQNGRDGSHLTSGLAFDAAGHLYGTTSAGGTGNGGTVFELEPAAGGGWNKKTIENFRLVANEQQTLLSGLVLDATGNVYGTTCCDGTYGGGSVFELTPVAGGGWQKKSLRVFDGRTGGGMPQYGPLLLDASGNVYGTTSGGGAHGVGTVFELSSTASGLWTETVLHSFSLGIDGDGNPYGKPVFDVEGNLYGTAQYGGVNGLGSVFELVQTSGGWTEKVLHSFTAGTDGIYPFAGVIFDSDGNLFGTTAEGGSSNKGTVYKLTHNSDGSWKESVAYSFTGGSDGGIPYSNLLLDAAGNLYGTARGGGIRTFPCDPTGCGVVYELMKNTDDSWSESVLYTFTGGDDGDAPSAGLTFDSSGNLYGTAFTTRSGNAGGAVFKLTPLSGSWTQTVLYDFPSGALYGGVVLDAAGNLYGANSGGGGGYGSIFELTPASGTWTLNNLYSFTNKSGNNDGIGPYAGVTFDGSGNLYGATFEGGTNNRGTVFKLTQSSGHWAESVLYSFGSGHDLMYPQSDLTLDSAGNIYGAAFGGGPASNGGIFEIVQ
jgi:uncharacterized repeat protein (TIGR03803 family)